MQFKAFYRMSPSVIQPGYGLVDSVARNMLLSDAKELIPLIEQEVERLKDDPIAESLNEFKDSLVEFVKQPEA